MGKKRKDRHGVVLKAALPVLRDKGFEATQFHHYSRMPKSLKGVPDLYLLKAAVSWWIEIKPLYANYMRDQMSTHQWQWFHERRPHLGAGIRYAIVENAREILDFVLDESRGIHTPYDCISIPEYHLARYEQWRRGR